MLALNYFKNVNLKAVECKSLNGGHLSFIFIFFLKISGIFASRLVLCVTIIQGFIVFIELY